MSALASSIIDLTALWKIVAVSIVAGAGVVGAFGFVLLGISRYQAAPDRDLAIRMTSIVVIAVGGGFCLAAVVLGFIAMTHK